MFLYFAIKRIFDIVIGVTLLLLLSPLFIPVMVALRLTGEGEIFYRQKRVGYKNGTFGIWKFATMLKNSPNMGTGSLTLRNDPRLTPLGKYLRKSKINELPQVINLITGDMTLVGPRPQMSVDFEAYSPEVRSKIYDVRPGITGIGSIVFRDEEKLLSVEGRDPRKFYVGQIAPYKGEIEMWYQNNMSLATDFILLFLTVWVVFFPESKLHFKIFNSLPLLPAELQ